MYVLIILFALFCLYFFLKSVQNAIAFREFRESPGSFFFGHLPQLKSTTDILNIFTTFTNYAPTVKVRIFHLFYGLITVDYDFIEFLLNNSKLLEKSQNYNFLRPWLGSGLLLSEGKLWKRNRRIITPAFHFEILKQFVEVFESVGDTLIEKLNAFDGIPTVELDSLVSLCTLDIICETAMATKINAQRGDNVEYVSGVKEICRIITGRCLSFYKIPNWMFAMTVDYNHQKKLLKIVHAFTSKVIAKKMNNKELSALTTKRKLAFLDLMLQCSNNGELLSFDEIRNEVDTFMFEGHDTTASAISFVLYCLANHPDVQKKVYDEQVEMFGHEKKHFVTYQELQNMKYLELVIKETMRLYPPVPVIGRVTTKNMKFNGSKIPKGTNIAMFIYGLHRNPQYFPDPEKFDPERLANVDGSLPYAFIPFSAGTRNCIGQRFAMLEMKSVISKIVRHFELRPANPRHDLILAAEAVLKSVNGVRVGLKKRISLTLLRNKLSCYATGLEN